MSPTLRSAAGSDVGRRRPMNQDSAATTPRLLAVADGMGGHAHGEVASAVAVAALLDLDERLTQHESRRSSTCSPSSGRDRRRRGPAHRARPRRTPTCAAPAPPWSPSWSAERGSGSRTSATRGPTCCATTSCTGSPGTTRWCRPWSTRAGCRRRRRRCTRADPGWSARCRRTPRPSRTCSCSTAHLGDRYLICSDGVTAVLDDPEIGEVLLRRVRSRRGRGQRLIELANEGGGPDNITCVVADLVDGPRRVTRLRWWWAPRPHRPADRRPGAVSGGRPAGAAGAAAPAAGRPTESGRRARPHVLGQLRRPQPGAGQLLDQLARGAGVGQRQREGHAVVAEHGEVGRRQQPAGAVQRRAVAASAGARRRSVAPAAAPAPSGPARTAPAAPACRRAAAPGAARRTARRGRAAGAARAAARCRPPRWSAPAARSGVAAQPGRRVRRRSRRRRRATGRAGARRPARPEPAAHVEHPVGRPAAGRRPRPAGRPPARSVARPEHAPRPRLHRGSVAAVDHASGGRRAADPNTA